MAEPSSNYFKRLYFSLQGRVSRQAYWLFFFLPLFLIGVVLGFLIGGMHVPSRNVVVILFLLAPLLIWVGVAVSVKRLHDLGRSGWWAVLCFVPYLNYVAMPILGIIPGKTGSNAYGKDPRGANPKEP
jgi:uncharacterized membrane protein YhaH (DUF805 family)